jgi:spore coat protein H
MREPRLFSRERRLLAGLACTVWFALATVTFVDAQTARPAGWNESTHGRQTAPDYGRLFAMDKVHELTITIAPERFLQMKADLEAVVRVPFGPFASPGGRGSFGPGRAGGRQGGGPPSLTTRDPIYVPVTVGHDRRVWKRVGMRFKGNSSLMATNMSGNGKIPFRLDFDRYEAEFPEIRNQRFYGFRKLTFSSNFGDDSQIREVLATEIFRDRGVPAPRAAFYRVFVDTGNGPAYWGLYSMIEDPADGAMLDAQFGSRRGNLYKPEGPGADWTRFVEEGFVKKTNERAADFGDVKKAIDALHVPPNDPVAWRAGLEAALDVDLFLRWLAVNSSIGNWDAYGAMAHNYYLYADPSLGGRLRWIPWDNNFAFGAGPGAGRGFAGGPGRFGGPRRGGPPPDAAAFPFPPLPGGRDMPMPPPFGMGTDVLHRQIGERWPLIQRVLADEVYAARYREYLARSLEGLAAPGAIDTRVRELHALIAPHVVGRRGERPTHTTVSSPTAFEGAIDAPGGLLYSIGNRYAAVRAALAEPVPR